MNDKDNINGYNSKDRDALNDDNLGKVKEWDHNVCMGNVNDHSMDRTCQQRIFHAARSGIYPYNIFPIATFDGVPLFA